MPDNAKIAALEQRLSLLEDKDALRSLRDAYHACINDGRYADISDLCADDAVIRLGYLARYQGRAQIDAGFKGMGERERFFIKQYIHSHQVSVTDDIGAGVSYLEARYGRFGVSYLVSGCYRDKYIRKADVGGSRKWISISTIPSLPVLNGLAMKCTI